MSASYSALAFVGPTSDFRIPDAADLLATHPSLAGVRVEVVSDEELALEFDGWVLRIRAGEGDDLAAEACELAGASPEYAQVDELARCRRAVSIWSEDADPEMDHFNDYLLTVQALTRGFSGLHARDNASRDWFD